MCIDSTLFLFKVMKHDSIVMWAMAVNKTIEQGYQPYDGLRVTENIYNMDFMGLTGRVVIDHKGDRYQDYVVRFQFITESSVTRCI